MTSELPSSPIYWDPTINGNVAEGYVSLSLHKYNNGWLNIYITRNGNLLRLFNVKITLYKKFFGPFNG